MANQFTCKDSQLPNEKNWSMVAGTRKGGALHGVAVEAAWLERRGSRVWAPLWSSSFKETKCFSPAHS